MKPDFSAYLQSWAQEFQARASRVRQLIGDAHWLSDGQHKEALLREFLVRYLPNRFQTSRGFVKSPSLAGNCSPEIDILIFDPSTHPALFSEGNFHIVAPTSVVAHLEVKSELTKQSLSDALRAVAKTQITIDGYADAEKVWRCICFFSVPASRTAESVLDTVGVALTELAQSLREGPTAIRIKEGMSISTYMPNCIVTLLPYTLFITPRSPSSIIVKIFDLGEIGYPCAFAELYAAIRVWIGGALTGELDDMIETLEIPAPLSLVLEL